MTQDRQFTLQEAIEKHRSGKPFRCRCGCNSVAMYWVESEDSGKPFGEGCCLDVSLYLSECAHEENAPFKRTPISC